MRTEPLRLLIARGSEVTKSLTRLLVLLAVLSACSPSNAQPPTTSSSTPSSPSPSRIPDMLLNSVRALQPHWEPSGLTVILGTASAAAVTLTAVAIDKGTTLQIAQLPPVGSSAWSARPDGVLIAVAVPTSATTSRLALLDLRSAQARWLTPDLHANEITPIWSGPDSLLFGRSDSRDAGILRISADGSKLTPIRPSPASGAVSSLTLVGPQGMLVGADQFNGAHPWVRDIASGRENALSVCCGTVQAWRAARPRALIDVTTDTLAPPKGYLALWDDTTGAVTKLTDVPVGRADFDPTGTRVVYATQTAPSDPPHLVVMDLASAQARALAGSDGAQEPRWLSTGIVYLTRLNGSDQFALRMTAPSDHVVMSGAGAFRGMAVVGQ